ncbi:hypothetical protein GCM10027451_19600 [Geodermatophilus aquaeductus]|uniref:Uncharacterized protein n=1 Tax=Geodermatophilus aquaeductus TaxID=1564161 RepID=A0A521EAK4_9ACTN|nr:hypothetical protein [Geodermatophilus aquaeductus]SMO80966.1 hypothetical protein SAMN06273567_104376 [Geodermatophilus aquaeductus]
MALHSASSALPFEHLMRATAGLRAQLRQEVLAAEGPAVLPAWSTLQVTGPHPVADGRGRAWFGYRATIDVAPGVPGEGSG